MSESIYIRLSTIILTFRETPPFRAGRKESCCVATIPSVPTAHPCCIGYKTLDTLVLRAKALFFGRAPVSCSLTRYRGFVEAIRSTVKYLRLRTLQGVNFRAESAAPTKRGTLFKVAHWRGLPSRAYKPATSSVLQGGVLTDDLDRLARDIQPPEIQLAVEHLVNRLEALVEQTIGMETPSREEEP